MATMFEDLMIKLIMSGDPDAIESSKKKISQKQAQEIKKFTDGFKDIKVKK